MEDMHQEVCHAGHDKELCTGSCQDVPGALPQDAEIVGAEGQAHGEHDDAENDGLGHPLHPCEELGQKKSHDGDGYDKKGDMGGEPTAQGLQ